MLIVIRSLKIARARFHSKTDLQQFIGQVVCGNIQNFFKSSNSFLEKLAEIISIDIGIVFCILSQLLVILKNLPSIVLIDSAPCITFSSK